jgi:hypothetical protein
MKVFDRFLLILLAKAEEKYIVYHTCYQFSQKRKRGLMEPKYQEQLSKLVDRSEPVNILNEVRRHFYSVYDRESFSPVERGFMLIAALFRGDFPGYKRCSTAYHDFNHTLDTFLATARILDGYAVSDGTISMSVARRVLLAALFHDAGYIQEEGDNEGTGAKYTQHHVERSEQFVFKNASTFGLTQEDAEEISLLIRFTDMSCELVSMNNHSSEKALVGKMLGTADLLGQMADRTYLEKLLFLYHEFREAGIEGFATEFDIIRKTKGFYEIAMKRLDIDLGQVYRFASDHFNARHGINKNLYIESLERQIAYLDEIMKDDQTNFRKKLKRLDLEAIGEHYHNQSIQ